MQRIYRAVLLIACLSLPDQALAAGAYMVDDADIVDPGSWQSESWFTHTDTGKNLGVINAMHQILPETELTLQASIDTLSGGANNLFSPQIKYRFHTKDHNGVTASMVIGTDVSLNRAHQTNLMAYMPVTWNVNDSLDLNGNLGWLYTDSTHHHSTLWGMGGEYHVNERYSGVGEVFGRSAESPGFQFGPRMEVNETVQLDLVFGHNVFSSHEQLITAGLTLNL